MVIRQISRQYKCHHPLLNLQLNKVKSLLQDFDNVQFQHILRLQNREANQMAQTASGVKIPQGQSKKVIRIQKRFLPFSIEKDEDQIEVMILNVTERLERSGKKIPDKCN